MQPSDKAARLRIYISSTDKYEHTPLYEVIVYAARSYGLTGATVLKGIMGFGASSEVYSNKIWEISEKVPLIIEIIDETHRIEPFLEKIKPYFEKAGKGFIITLDETTVVMHKIGKRDLN
jgi:PII-like signaling protein